MKKCTKCKTEKNLVSFRRDQTKSDGYAPSCTACKKIVENLWREKNRALIRRKQRASYKKNSEIIKQKRKDNYDPIKSKARWLAKKIEAKQCIFCDKMGERHHQDYTKPLDIVFLCKSHHAQLHNGTIELNV